MENLLFLGIILAGVLYYIYQKKGIKPEKKLLGGILLIIAIAFLNPILDFTDIFLLPLYSMYSGIDVSLNNLSAVYLDYFIWSMVIGVILLFGSMRLLGWNLKRIYKKFNIGKYNVSLFLAVLAVLAVAAWDVWGAQSGIFGSLFDYTHGFFGVDGWWNLFYKYVLILFLAVPISYYFLVKDDFSESLGIFIFSLGLYFGGLADLFYFVFLRSNLPSELPWLTGSPFINFISTKIMGLSTVTDVSLLVSIILSFILVWIFARVMKERF